LTVTNTRACLVQLVLRSGWQTIKYETWLATEERLCNRYAVGSSF
jgi:hypothetical protein